MHKRTRGFTIAELVVAMGIIAIISVITVIAFRQVGRSMRQASGVNALMASLGNARALAMKDNKIVAVVFRPRLDGPNEMYVEIALVEWTRQAALVRDFFGPGDHAVVDRFVPVQNIVPKKMPRGIKVAGPLYGDDLDHIWTTQANLPTINQVTGAGEPPGRLLGVMYGPDGALLSSNSSTDANFMFVDFNNDGSQQLRNATFDYGTTFPTQPSAPLFEQVFERDECMVAIVPFIAVYDDDEARSLRGGTWENDVVRYTNELIGPQGYISTRAKPIHFNRYTGVAMK